jgi:hypothetical protein
MMVQKNSKFNTSKALSYKTQSTAAEDAAKRESLA